ncbi:MAG: hypothetical protein GPJ52_02020 [Candidatus Heimdallarchaeota archaeon]|nr:hypothetical protein [Candidatus Heimdallarchaeota archaeon]
MNEEEQQKICIEPYCNSLACEESVYCDWHIKMHNEFHRAMRGIVI